MFIEQKRTTFAVDLGRNQMPGRLEIIAECLFQNFRIGILFKIGMYDKEFHAIRPSQPYCESI